MKGIVSFVCTFQHQAYHLFCRCRYALITPTQAYCCFQKHCPDSGHCLTGQLGQRTPRFLYAHSLWSTIFTQAVIGWSKNMNKRTPSTMLKFIKKNVFLPLVLSNLGKFSYLCIANHHKNERKIQNCLF